MKRRRPDPGLALTAALVLGACAGAEPAVVEDRERGCRYELPAGWRTFDNEIRSRDMTLFETRVYELDGAAADFVDGLPESVVPQLAGWAREYFVVDGPPERATATIGGETALALSYPVRVRAGDPVGRLAYWIVRRGSRLYVLRATFRPDAPARDHQAVDRILESWRFLDPETS